MPNPEILLQMIWSLISKNVKDVRLAPKLKFIKNYRTGTSMGEEKSNPLALLLIGHELSRNFNFDEIFKNLKIL